MNVKRTKNGGMRTKKYKVRKTGPGLMRKKPGWLNEQI